MVQRLSRRCRLTNDATETDMARRGVHRLRMTRGRAVTAAVIRGFQSLQNLGVLNDRSNKGQHAGDDETAAEDQGAADGIDGIVFASEFPGHPDVLLNHLDRGQALALLGSERSRTGQIKPSGICHGSFTRGRHTKTQMSG